MQPSQCCTPDRAEGTLRFSYPDAELVFGVVCAVGANYRQVEKRLSNQLRLYGYRPNVIRLSDMLSQICTDLKLPVKLSDESEYARIRSRMDAGNAARMAANVPELMALAGISKINSKRPVSASSSEQKPDYGVAHILLTLKRAEEVELLRRVYGPGFFLVGVYASQEERTAFLQDEHGMCQDEADDLMRKDEEDDHPCGQQTRDTFHRSDVFVRLKGYKLQLDRFLNLVFQHPYHTPEIDEHAMFQAYAAGLRSGQLGRQVGAAIVSAAGDLIAVGCNEVPCAGGGAYWPGPYDHRDHKIGYDSNDRQKRLMAEDIVNRIGKDIGEGFDRNRAFKSLRKSMLFDITEFGRAVHAEMDAILSCARTGASTRGATLYTTTFPCHNCTRHIIGAGIARVVFIEPYPKSMAMELHTDSIRIEGMAQKTSARNTLPFEPFIGIGPKRYAEFFSVQLSTGFSISRKRDGNVIDWHEAEASPRTPMQPVSYLGRERLAAEELKRILNKVANSNENDHSEEVS